MLAELTGYHVRFIRVRAAGEAKSLPEARRHRRWRLPPSTRWTSSEALASPTNGWRRSLRVTARRGADRAGPQRQGRPAEHPPSRPACAELASWSVGVLEQASTASRGHDLAALGGHPRGGREACPRTALDVRRWPAPAALPGRLMRDAGHADRRADQALPTPPWPVPAEARPAHRASESWLSQVERGVRSVDRLSTIIELMTCSRVRSRPDRPTAVPRAQRRRPLRPRGRPSRRSLAEVQLPPGSAHRPSRSAAATGSRRRAGGHGQRARPGWHDTPGRWRAVGRSGAIADARARPRASCAGTSRPSRLRSPGRVGTNITAKSLTKVSETELAVDRRRAGAGRRRAAEAPSAR